MLVKYKNPLDSALSADSRGFLLYRPFRIFVFYNAL